MGAATGDAGRPRRSVPPRCLAATCGHPSARSLASPHARRRGPSGNRRRCCSSPPPLGRCGTRASSASAAAALDAAVDDRTAVRRTSRRVGPGRVFALPQVAAKSTPAASHPRRAARRRQPPRPRRPRSRRFSTSQPVHDAVRSNEPRRGTSTRFLPARPGGCADRRAAARTKDRADTDGPTRPRRSRRGRATGARSRPETEGGAQCDPERRAGVGRARQVHRASRRGVQRRRQRHQARRRARARCGPSRGGGRRSRSSAHLSCASITLSVAALSTGSRAAAPPRTPRRRRRRAACPRRASSGPTAAPPRVCASGATTYWSRPRRSRGRVLVGGDGPVVEEVLRRVTDSRSVRRRPKNARTRSSSRRASARKRHRTRARARGASVLPQQRGQQVDAHVGVPPRELRARRRRTSARAAPRRPSFRAQTPMAVAAAPVPPARRLLRGPRCFLRAEHAPCRTSSRSASRSGRRRERRKRARPPGDGHAVRQARATRSRAQDVRLRRVVAGGLRGAESKSSSTSKSRMAAPPHAVDHRGGGDHRDREDAHGDAPRASPLARGHLQVLDAPPSPARARAAPQRPPEETRSAEAPPPAGRDAFAARRASAAPPPSRGARDSQTTNAAIARGRARARARAREAAARAAARARAPRRPRARACASSRRDDGQRRLERRRALAVHRDVLHARVLDRPLDGAADRGRRGVVDARAEHGVVLRRRAQGPRRARARGARSRARAAPAPRSAVARAAKHDTSSRSRRRASAVSPSCAGAATAAME